MRDWDNIMNWFECGPVFFNQTCGLPLSSFTCFFFPSLGKHCSHPLMTETFPYQSQYLNVWWHMLSCGIYSGISIPGGTIKNAWIRSVWVMMENSRLHRARLFSLWGDESATSQGCHSIWLRWIHWVSTAHFSARSKMSITQLLHSSLIMLPIQ